MILSSYKPTSPEVILFVEMETTKMTKLRDDNYYKWSYEMRMNLQSRGLWKNCEYDSFESYVIEMKLKESLDTFKEQSQ